MTQEGECPLLTLSTSPPKDGTIAASERDPPQPTPQERTPHGPADSGRIYTGVCIDTASTLGICAERNAIFTMVTAGEQKISKVIAILPDGSSGAPCGACRELMVQLMPKDYQGIQIMMDYPTERVVTLGELTPEWWIH